MGKLTVFPKNKVTHFSAMPDINCDFLNDLCLQLSTIEGAFKDFDVLFEKALNSNFDDYSETDLQLHAGIFLKAMRELSVTLLNCVVSPKEGDICYQYENICVNIFNPYEDVAYLWEIASELIDISGEQTVSCPFPTFENEFRIFIHYSIINTSAPYLLWGEKQKKLLPIFDACYWLMQYKRSRRRIIFTYQNLNSLLTNFEKLPEAKDDELFQKFIQVRMNRINNEIGFLLENKGKVDPAKNAHQFLKDSVDNNLADYDDYMRLF